MPRGIFLPPGAMKTRTMNNAHVSPADAAWQELMTKLSEPFPAADIEWRVGRSGMRDGKPWASVLAYVTNRAIMDRLDAVLGAGHWQNEIRPLSLEKKGAKLEDCATYIGFMCGLGLRYLGGWVWKWDASDCSDIEAIKGGVSGSMKRAAVHWGIGRYLYNLGDGWAVFTDGGMYSAKIDGTWHKWSPPQLPGWALPAGSAPNVGHSPSGEGEDRSPATEGQESNRSAISVPRDPTVTTTRPADWKAVAIHFGKNKGVELGRLESKSLGWYISEWQPKEYKGRFSDADLALRAALDAACDELEERGEEY